MSKEITVTEAFEYLNKIEEIYPADSFEDDMRMCYMLADKCKALLTIANSSDFQCVMQNEENNVVPFNLENLITLLETCAKMFIQCEQSDNEYFLEPYVERL